MEAYITFFAKNLCKVKLEDTFLQIIYFIFCIILTYLDCTDNHKSRIKYCHAQKYGKNNSCCIFIQRDDYHIPVGIYSEKCNDCQDR